MSENHKPPTKSNSNALGKLSLFGPPPLLEGEDSTAYDELLARISGGLNPKDIFEEMWVRDIVDTTWEILRWRRLKTKLLDVATPQALEETLNWIEGDWSMDPEDLNILPKLDFSFEETPSPSQVLAKKWAARNATAIKRVAKTMGAANVTMDTVLARALRNEIDYIERIDRLAAVAEMRRNAVLREIERHRSSIAQTLTKNVSDAEESKFTVLESKRIA